MRWGVAGNIVLAWVLTLPAAAAIGAAHLRLSPGSSAPARWARCVVSLIAISLVVAAFARRAQQGAPVPAASGRRDRGDLVEGKELLETVVASLVAGVGRDPGLLGRDLGRARFADLSRDERRWRRAARRPWRCSPWPPPRRASSSGSS